MAGTIPLSMTQQFDIYGKPLAGGQLYIMVAGTVSTPQDAFQDINLSIKMPYPMTLDAAGRIPQFFLADGTVKIRLQDVSGVVQLAADSVLVIGPSAGGGGGGTVVDPTTLIQTGDLKSRYGTGALTGYVRCNGLTVGSATSGATERANLDCQNCFQYLWGADPNLVVSSGRGASAAADWAANKQIALPDWRGYAVSGLDDMGNSAAGRLTSAAAGFGAVATVLGAVGGGQSFTLTATHIPASGLSVGGTTTNDSPDHTHSYSVGNATNVIQSTATFPALTSLAGGTTGGASTRHTHGFSASLAGGGGQAHRTIGPRKLCTIYMKL